MNTVKRTLAAIGVGGLLAAGILTATPAHAVTPGCQQVPWGFLGSQQRLICDGPIQPDGSWTRHRIVGVPEHYAPARSYCSGGAYYSSCTYSPGGWVDQVNVSDEFYPVNDSIVLPDEPGHLAG